jgi:hypothetical protein
MTNTFEPDYLEQYYKNTSIDNLNGLYQKNSVNDTDYSSIDDYYKINLKNKYYQQNDGNFLDEGKGDNFAKKGIRRTILNLHSQGDRNDEIPEYSQHGFKSENEPQVEAFDFSKYVNISKKRSPDITKRLYPDVVPQLLSEHQGDPGEEVIYKVIRQSIDKNKPQLYQYTREFVNCDTNNNILCLNNDDFKRIRFNDDIDFNKGTNKFNKVSTFANQEFNTNINLIEKELNKKNNIIIVNKNVNNKILTYVKMLVPISDGKYNIIEFELKNYVNNTPKNELFKIINNVLNDITVNEFSDKLKKNNLGNVPNNSYVIKLDDDINFSNNNCKSLKHNNLKEPVIHKILKKIITEIINDNITKDSREQINIKNYIFNNKCNLPAAIIDIITKDSVINKIQQIISTSSNSTNKDRIKSVDTLIKNNDITSYQKKLWNDDVNFHLNKNNMFDDNTQLIDFQDTYHKPMIKISHTPFEYNNDSKFLHNSIKETKSFNN